MLMLCAGNGVRWRYRREEKGDEIHHDLATSLITMISQAHSPCQSDQHTPGFSNFMSLPSEPFNAGLSSLHLDVQLPPCLQIT